MEEFSIAWNHLELSYLYASLEMSGGLTAGKRVIFPDGTSTYEDPIVIIATDRIAVAIMTSDIADVCGPVCFS